MEVTAALQREAEEAIWHELECGGYRADLSLWLALAKPYGRARVLDLGAGSGRVALTLARAGHEITAVDLDGGLLQRLRERAHQFKGLRMETITADARSLDLGRNDYDLCVVAMQTIQLFGGAPGRAQFLRSARRHVRPGGVIACAIVTQLDEFSVTSGEAGPEPERLWRGERLYVSRPTSVRVGRDTITLERERRVIEERRPPTTRQHVVELARLDADQLETEALASGLHPLPRTSVPETAEHAGSEVVRLGV
jgi:SAM-dependent methyltransferase